MDVAIVGGGVAGCYCAYRLAHAHRDWDIELFEASDRFGGRLWSVPIAGFSGAPAEMGGMFLSSKHHNAYRLASDHLKLGLSPVRWSQKHQYLRNDYLDNKTYAANPAAVPFGLDEAEQNKHPITLLLHALNRIIPGLDALWPMNEKGSSQATFRYLRLIHHKGRPLYEWGFWNVLSDVISNEAYNLLMSTIGYGSVFRNANALESIWTLLRNMDRSQVYYRIAGGYQELPLTLLRGAKDVVKINAGHRLLGVKRDGAAFTLRFDTGYGEVSKRADKLILAMPRRSLQLIDLDDDLFDDVDQFKRNLDAVTPAAACKVFMTFDEPWWDRSKFGPGALEPGDVAVAFTDLPMRQCYYFGKREAAEGPVLLMAAYTDDIANGFWAGLACGDDDSFSNPAVRANDQQTLWCSKPMVVSACKQLSAMHNDEPAPEPSGALFVNWGRDPYGAGWHDWAPNVRSWRVARQMRQPNPALDLFICGEAFSQRQGWVEGAVNSAEMVLRRLGLEPPEWLSDPDHEFEVEGEPKMASKLSELLVALSENLALQRAYARDPEAIMGAFGLSDTEKAALRSGDEKSIKALAGGMEKFNVIISAGPQ